jgi:hypothetical protein
VTSGATSEGPLPFQNRGGGHAQSEDELSFHCSALPKLSFPKFNGENPWIWIDKCGDYFRIFNIFECLWTTVASLHMEENTTKWLQVYVGAHKTLISCANMSSKCIK